VASGETDEERQPRLARRSPFVHVSKLCPRCLSPLSEEGKLGGWLIPQSYFCEKCGYTGTVYLEKDHSPQEEK